jgi:hypothetical protein
MHIESGNGMLYLTPLVRYFNWMSNSPNTCSIDRNTPCIQYTLNIRDRKITLVHHNAVFGKEEDRCMDNAG